MIGRRYFGLAAFFIAVLLLGTGAWCGAQSVGPHDFGTADTNYYYVSAEEFQPFLPQTTYWQDAGTGGARYVTGASLGIVSANVRLPSGALITGMAVVYEDSDAVNDFEVQFLRTWWGIGSRGSEIIGFFFSSGTPGITRTYVDINPDHTVAYTAAPISVQTYRLVAFMDASSHVQLRGVIMYWNRQISPAPITATFGDVPTVHPFFQHIEALAASGITAGCGGSNYCPSDPITRGQMAVFLAKALGLHWEP